MPLYFRTNLAAACTAALAIALVGCATPAPTQIPSAQSPAADSPLSNCGTEVEYSNPQRVVTIKSSTTEMMLALGLEDRIVGMAFQDGPVPDEWADAAAEIPVIAERVPSEEAVLGLEPDLVYAGWESNFSADGAGERAELQSFGVDTYVSPSACQSLEGRQTAVTAEDILDEIAEVAAIFEADASELIASQRAMLNDIEPLTDGHTALWFSSGSDTPFVGGGTGAPALILERLGLRNIAGELDEAWAPFNWEAVVNANPDVIVLVDAAWNSAEKKIGVLEANPATANLDAVKNGRYLVIPFPASEAGVRTIPAMVELSAQLAELGLRD